MAHDAGNRRAEVDLVAVGEHYESLLSTHGTTPKGVGWRNTERQAKRFRQLTSCIETRSGFSVLDVGCGYGALFDYIGEQSQHFTYTGTDIAPAMIDRARQMHAGVEGCNFSAGPPPESTFDYVFASGIFNVMRATSRDAWEEHVFHTMREMFSRARKAMACNFLTIHSDPELREEELFYADPTTIMNFCINNLSLNMALSHHYNTWDFTIQVFADAAYAGCL